MRKRIGCTLLFFTLTSISASAECKQLTDESRQHIAVYIAKRLKALPGSVSITKEEYVAESCYIKVTLAGAVLDRPLTLFLSPDQRFLSTSLLDTTMDPDDEVKEEIAHNKQALRSEDSPARGSPVAPVRVVEFSDFQCPFCKKFEDWMHDLPPDLSSQVQLVYRHFPLSIHPWAHEAAALAVCANLQSPDAFWKLHDFFFAQQAALSPRDLRVRVTEFAATVPGLSKSRLLACADHGQAEATIYHDKELADQLDVDGTPTVFINGVRADGLDSLSDFELQLRQALRDSRTLPTGAKKQEEHR
jgi:protein-disulfide isomerase